MPPENQLHSDLVELRRAIERLADRITAVEVAHRGYETAERFTEAGWKSLDAKHDALLKWAAEFRQHEADLAVTEANTKAFGAVIQRNIPLIGIIITALATIIGGFITLIAWIRHLGVK